MVIFPADTNFERFTMQGVFTLTKYDAQGFSDQDFDEASKKGKLKELLSTLKVNQECKAVSNRIFDNMAAYLFFHKFAGSNIKDPFDDVSFGAGAVGSLGTICLLTTDTETTDYTEFTSEGVKTPSQMIDSVNTSNAGKRFVEDFSIAYDRAAHVVADPGFLNREAISFEGNWLYAVDQVVSTNIRSLGIYFSALANSTGQPKRGRIGRVRLKDSAGNPIILHKTNLEVLLVKYTFTLVSN